MADSPQELAGPSYEQAREELVDVVRRLEAGGTGLEESLALWERGEALARVCQGWLDGARGRLDAALARNDHAADVQRDRATDVQPAPGSTPQERLSGTP